jgi:hypothetical protein
VGSSFNLVNIQAAAQGVNSEERVRCRVASLSAFSILLQVSKWVDKIFKKRPVGLPSFERAELDWVGSAHGLEAGDCESSPESSERGLVSDCPYLGNPMLGRAVSQPVGRAGLGDEAGG